jgi:hypothetical protein
MFSTLQYLSTFYFILDFFMCVLFFYICSYVYTSFGPPLPSDPWPPLITPHPTFRQNLFWPLVLQFCWRENTKDNKKHIAFLLLRDEDCYIERFLVLLPCTCVLQPTLVHLNQISSLLHGHLPIVGSTHFRWLYLLAYSEHISHIQVLGFLPFPYSSHAHSPLSVWQMSNNITAFVLGL